MITRQLRALIAMTALGTACGPTGTLDGSEVGTPTGTHDEPRRRSTLFLSDVPWQGASNGWGPVERDASNGPAGENDGRPITIGGVGYDKGLGVHARSRVRFELEGDCETFSASIGIDDEVAGGSVRFHVYGDDAVLYQSDTRTGSDPAVDVEVDIAGVDVLELVVTDARDGGSGDHADWADARVVCSYGEAAPGAPAMGTGLRATFYDDREQTVPLFTRTDPRVGFEWDTGFASSPAGTEGLSAEWVGEVEARYSERYVFSLRAPGAGQLWIDGAPVIDADETTDLDKTGEVMLQAGARHSIRLLYWGDRGDSVSLLWSSASQVEQRIPQRRLFPAPSTVPAWRALALVVRHTDVAFDEGGVQRRLQTTLTEEEEAGAIDAAVDSTRRLVRWSSGRGNMKLDVEVVEEAITTMSPYGEGYWVGPGDIADLLDTYAPEGAYDSIFLIWDPDSASNRVPICCHLGLQKTGAANNATFASIPSFSDGTWGANGLKPGEVFVHEWMHGSAHYYREILGLNVPDPHDSQQYGFDHSDEDRTWTRWYTALLSGEAVHVTTGERAGYGADVWARGTILEPVDPAP